jgi:hypothetical protein
MHSGVQTRQDFGFCERLDSKGENKNTNLNSPGARDLRRRPLLRPTRWH